MNILGVNAGQMAPRGVGATHPLADGSAALLSDGVVACAAIEERLTRVRYQGGFRRSAAACLRQGQVALNDIGVFALSSCCGPRWTREEACQYLVNEFSAAGLDPGAARLAPERVVVVDHHLSHAMLAFASMPPAPDPVLVCVLDGMGNRTGPALHPAADQAWWQGGFQRQTYYLARWAHGRARFEPVHEEAGGADEIGIGEIYRALTHFLGWHSYQHAGKTMALAAFGDADAYAGAQFILHDAERGIRVPVPNWHDQPVVQVQHVLQRAGWPALAGFSADTAGPAERAAVDLAARLQRQVEQALTGLVPELAGRWGVRRIAFAGGVALNCVALGALHRAAPQRRLHVGCAPADTGQALGNALWAAYAEASPFAERHPPAMPPNRCDFGVRYGKEAVAAEVERLLARHGNRYQAVCCGTVAALAQAVGDRLVAQGVVGIRQGGAEYGPRALGHTSIVADPRRADMHARVNGHKRREPFRPYAPSVMTEHAPSWFEHAPYSPFMSFAARWTAQAARQVPAVVHVDGTARFQSVAPQSGLLRGVLEDFMRRTGVPVLLNTSFNAHGEPMVETPADAVASFVAMDLDALVLGDWFITRRQ